MKKWLRYTVLILLLWLLFVILCLVVPPLFHKEAGYGPGADAEGDSFSTPERILCIDDNKEALIWRLRLIGAAKERIILTIFDFRDEESGQDIMAALWEAEIQTTGFWDIIRKAITRIGICWSMERSRDKVVLFRRWKHLFMRFGISPAVRSLMQKAV